MAGAETARAVLKESENSRARFERDARTERDTVNASEGSSEEVRELSHLCGWQKRTIASQAWALASWQNCWWQMLGSLDFPAASGTSAEEPLPASSDGKKDYCVLGRAECGDDPCDDMAGWTQAVMNCAAGASRRRHGDLDPRRGVKNVPRFPPLRQRAGGRSLPSTAKAWREGGVLVP